MLALAPQVARAQTARPDQFPLGDLVEILVLENVFIAVDAEAGGTSTVERLLGERVLWTGTRGLVGVILTDERVLAIATRSSTWQEVNYRPGETPAQNAHLGDRLAVVVLPQRTLGFVGPLSRFTELRLGPQEDLRMLSVGANVAVLVTNRSALGLSPDAGGFFPIELQLREKIEQVVTRTNVATIHTDQRVLIFRGPTGTWSVRRK
jgi:hypothetical protein